LEKTSQTPPGKVGDRFSIFTSLKKKTVNEKVLSDPHLPVETVSQLPLLFYFDGFPLCKLNDFEFEMPSHFPFA
jgi:hypothetical protein